MLTIPMVRMIVDMLHTSSCRQHYFDFTVNSCLIALQKFAVDNTIHQPEYIFSPALKI